MLYDCDALHLNERTEKWRILNALQVPVVRHFPDLLMELAIFMHTPGLFDYHVAHMMGWDLNNKLPKARRICPKPDPLHVRNNANSITTRDGHAMLLALLRARPNYKGAVPLYVTRYLQSRREPAQILAREFGTTVLRIRTWRRANIFNPLTGEPWPASHVVRNRYVRPKLGVVL